MGIPWRDDRLEQGCKSSYSLYALIIGDLQVNLGLKLRSLPVFSTFLRAFWSFRSRLHQLDVARIIEVSDRITQCDGRKPSHVRSYGNEHAWKS